MSVIRFRAVASLVALLATLASEAGAQLSAADTSPAAELHTVVLELQTAVRRHDAGAIAALVAFPLRVNSGRHSRLVRSPAAFVREYDSLFNANVRAAVLAQDPDSTSLSGMGLSTLGKGQVWLIDDCALSRRRYRCLTISALNLDAPKVSPRAVPPNQRLQRRANRG